MGWASGRKLAREIEVILDDLRVPDKVWRGLARAFMDHDCDTLEECGGPIGDAANRLSAEDAGAPKDPAKGDIYANKWGERYEFDGKRWWFNDNG